MLIHLPGDKMFEAHVDLSAKTVNEIFTGYNDLGFVSTERRYEAPMCCTPGASK